jgi:glycosyltransferase involved in cell wall biosynthesis
VVGRAAAALRSLSPSLAIAASRRLPAPQAEVADIRRRLAYVQHVFETIDLFVAPSQAIADEFIQLGIDAARIEVSDYGFAPATPMPRKSRQAALPLRIGFVGTLVWHKGAHMLLEAARGLKGPFEIHVHGDETTFPAYAGDLRRLAAGLPVTFHGGFDRGSTALVYDNLDVLVVASLWPENSPLVIHEAFMHRVPVIAADIGGIAGLVVDGVNGLLYAAFSADALCAALQRAIDDPALLDLMSAARTRVKPIAQDAREWDSRYAVLAPVAAGAVATA